VSQVQTATVWSRVELGAMLLAKGQAGGLPVVPTVGASGGAQMLVVAMVFDSGGCMMRFTPCGLWEAEAYEAYNPLSHYVAMLNDADVQMKMKNNQPLDRATTERTTVSYVNL
jgi:hypothetical protein